MIFSKLSILWFCRRLVGRATTGKYRLYYVLLIYSLVFLGVFLLSGVIAYATICRYGKALILNVTEGDD